MTTFFRFPHTPHLAWLGASQPRADKVLDAEEMRTFLASNLVVEEKIDGANLGFSIDGHGKLRGQNRGEYLDLESTQGQWKPLKRWLATRQAALEAALAPQLVLFGEWCYAVHSVRYTHLPDWFLAFDVYDRGAGAFWSVDKRNALAASLDIATVPERARGHFDLLGLQRLLEHSCFAEGPPEGVYVRQENHGQLIGRAKLVRTEFVQHIDTHWSRRNLETNKVTREAPRASDATR